MCSIVFFKMLGELAVYYSVVTAFPKTIPLTHLPIAPLLLFALGQTANVFFQQIKKERIRLLSLILPIAGAAFSFTSIADFLITIPPLLYTGYTIITNPGLPGKYDVRAEFKTILIVASGALAVIAAAKYFTSTEVYGSYVLAYSRPKINVINTVIFYLIFLISMTYCLRSGRYGNYFKKQYHKYLLSEFLYIGVPTVLISFLMGKWLPVILKKLGIWLYEIRVANNAAAYFQQRARVRNDREAAQKFINDTKAARADITNPWLLSNKKNPPRKSFLSYIRSFLFDKISLEQFLIIIGIIVIILVLLLIIRKFLNGSWTKGYSFEYKVRSIKPTKKANKKIRKRQTLDNRAKVRKLYKEFLVKLKIKQVIITDSMTSADILNVLHNLFDRESAIALRNVYIVARYNDYADISDEQLEIATEALKHM